MTLGLKQVKYKHFIHYIYFREHYILIEILLEIVFICK